MSARQITTALKGRWYGSYGMVCCPVHPDRTPSLKIADSYKTNEGIYVHCFAGCDWKYAKRELRALGLVPEFEPGQSVSRSPRLRRDVIEPDRQKLANIKYAREICTASSPAAGTHVETYLRSRAITVSIPDTIRFHNGLEHTTGIVLPVMVALVTSGTNGTPQAIHRTFLSPDGTAKAAVEPNKMMLGPCAGGAVRLGPITTSLLAGEGIETCLSAMQATGLSAWAALSTSGLTRLELPKTVRDVIVLADGDEPGELAASSAAQRWRKEGRRVRIARPPNGLDFNDVLLGRRPVEEGSV